MNQKQREPSKTSLKYRLISKEDVDEVFEMVRSQTIYEGLEKKFKLTKEQLSNYLFGARNWHCLVVEDSSFDTLAGFILYTFADLNRSFHLAPLVYVDHIYVKPHYRKKGIGRNLIDHLKNLSKKKGVNRIELLCMKNNSCGQQFYKSLGVEKIDFIDFYRIQV